MAKVAHLEAGNGSTVHRGRNLPKRLPALTGPWLTAFTLLWLALLPLAVLAPVIGAAEQLARNQNPVWLPLGLAVQPEGDAIKIVTVLSREARTSGLKPGQEIIRIDGRPVPARNAITTVRPWLVRPEGAPMTLDVRDHRGSERRVQLTRREAHVREAFNRAGVSQRIGNGLPFVSNLLASLIFIPAAVLLFRRRRDSVPALLSLCLLIISASSFASSSFWLWRDLAEVGRWLNAAGWSALVLVLLTFPNGRFEPRWTLVVGFSTLVYLVGEGAALLPVAVTSLLLASLVSTAMLALLWRYRRLADTDERQQLRWVFLGFATGTVCLIIWTILVLAERKWGLQDPVWYFWLPLIRNPIGALGAAAVAIGLLVALLRYRLYDAETVISRSAAYLVMTVLAGAIFAGTAKSLELLFETGAGRDAGSAPAILGAALAAALVTPAHNKIVAWADRRFRKALLSLHQDLPECVSDLRETSCMRELLDEVLARITAGVRASGSAVLLNGRVAATRAVSTGQVESWLEDRRPNPDVKSLDCAPSDPLFPIRVPLRARRDVGEPLGWLLLGPRPDGTFYGRDEREALTDIADPVARALQVVLKREQREAEARRQVTMFQERLDALESTLTNLIAQLERRPTRSA
jgi:hypothetical protein